VLHKSGCGTFATWRSPLRMSARKREADVIRSQTLIPKKVFTGQNWLIFLISLYPVILSRELGKKCLRHSSFSVRNCLRMPQIRDFPC
jgi:hypothetical protein